MMKKKNAATNNSNSNSSTPTATNTPPLSPSILSFDDCSSTHSMTTPTPTTTTRSNNNKTMSNNKTPRLIISLSLVILALSLLQVDRAMTTTEALVRSVESAFLSDLLTQAVAAAAATPTTPSLTETPPSILTLTNSTPPTISTTMASSAAVSVNKNVVPVSVFQGQPFLDALCVGCREQTVQTGKHAHQSCGSLIYKQLQHGNKNNNSNSLVDATQTVLAKFANNDNTDECHLCRPDACLDRDKHYWRPDTVAPRVVHAKTLYLPSIPAVHRVPNPNLVNLTSYFSNSSSHNVHPHRIYFFEYNPSIVQIPKSQIPTHVLTPQQATDTVYLASFRVTNTQQCVHGPDEVMMIGGKWPRPPSQDYLGLALLRHDLSIIVDVVLDNQKKNNNNNNALHGMEDYRLFVLNEQIYVASFHKIVPLWLVPPTNINNENENVVALVENKFPSILTVHARTFASCAGSGGKNINYFIDSSAKSKKEVAVVVAELYPMLGKMAVNLEQPCHPDDKKAKKQAAAQVLLHHNATLPAHQSFGSYEEIHFFNHGAFGTMSGERGSGCCVEIPNPTTSTTSSNSSSISSNYLLLGISHSKTKFKTKATRDNLPGNVSANHFFSAFYAMEPHEPFTVRARSGRFCLGFPNANETATNDDMDNKDKNPFARNNMVQLRLGGNHYDCPRIHFVSGMVEKANDPSRIIIAYGIQDCAPRFIEVEKLQVLQMLFPDMF